VAQAEHWAPREQLESRAGYWRGLTSDGHRDADAGRPRSFGVSLRALTTVRWAPTVSEPSWPSATRLP